MLNFNPQGSLFYQMIIHAGPMAKLVLFILTLMSIFSWAIMVNKWLIFRKVKRQTEAFRETFWRTGDLKIVLAEARNYAASPLSLIFQEAFLELKRWLKDKNAFKRDRKAFLNSVNEAMRKAAYTEYSHLRKGLAFLATVGNTAPFIGLFGTVWGIMRAFHDIGLKGSASLADVAPGISEALIATAFGLAAAIPAVIGYNYFTQCLIEQKTEMDNFATDLQNRLKRKYLIYSEKEVSDEII